MNKLSDERISQLANILSEWSLGIQENDNVYIDSYEPAMKLIDKIYRTAVNKGANLTLDVSPEASEHELFLKGNGEQIRERFRQKLRLARRANKLILIESREHPELSEEIPNERHKFIEELEKPFYSLIWSKGKRSVIVHFPTKGYAREAGLSLSEYEDAVYGMTLLNWEEESRRIHDIANLFRGVRRIRIEGYGTDLLVSVNGEPTIEDGKENMPAGEIYFGGMKGASAYGKVYFDVPVFYNKEIRDARFEFRKGRIITATATLNEDYLRRLLLDEHIGFLEEIGFGTNPYASTSIPSWAEKSYGTIHVGVDNANGTNIDITKTMNPGRALVYGLGDRKGRTVLENGIFLL